jgi:hypothetical protein
LTQIIALGRYFGKLVERRGVLRFMPKNFSMPRVAHSGET